MSEKELKEFKTVLQKQRQKVQSSPKAAKALLKSLGLLTPKGNLKKSFKPSSCVSG